MEEEHQGEQTPEASSAPAETEPPSAEREEQSSHQATPAETVTPSKSNLVDKRASTISRQSHVRLVEPGGEEGEEKKMDTEAERRPSEAERKKSDAERRQSEAERRRSERLSREMSAVSAGYRGSRASQRPSASPSREGILRRRSDRPSKAKSAVGSIISIRRTASGYGEFLGGAKAAKFMNTYKLDSDNPFHAERVQNILRDVLTEALDNLTYDPDKCPKQAKWASSAIRAKVKEQDYDRYKLVIIVTIGEKRYQDMCSVVRFLWDIDRDKYALFVHENMYVYAAAMCFGLYYE